MRTHGMRNSKEYNTWRGMKERCSNPNNRAYKHYGGRDISICDIWFNSFEKFYEDMGPKPSPKHSLDRIDVDKGTTKTTADGLRTVFRLPTLVFAKIAEQVSEECTPPPVVNIRVT